MKVIASLMKFVEVDDFGQVGCGRVVPFTSKTRVTIAVDRNTNYRRRTYRACGDSLIEKGIDDGDTIICKLDFTLPETFNKICIIRHIATDEIVAKILVPNYDGTVTLKAANPYYLDKTVRADSIEIIGIVKKVQKNVD